MTAIATTVRHGGGSIGRRVSRFWSAISAVSIKELRGRMRGRRAFVVLTIYLLLLGAFSFAIYFYLKQQAGQVALTNISDPGIPRDFPGFPGFPDGGGMPFQQTLANGTALSAGIGHGIFGGLLFLETLLVLVLAPAFTTGAISLEREKQTLDMLVTTPLSTLGMIIGKLFSALIYVFLLIIASIPLASLVFVFGGVGPEDLVRAYVFLFALAFGMGAIGLFISAIVRRTQTATVFTFVLVLLLSIGTAAAHQFWQMATSSSPSTTSVLTTSSRGKAPEALLWLNPFVADLDMVCATAPDSYHQSCDYISSVTRKPYFGTPPQTNPSVIIDDFGFPQPGIPKMDVDGAVLAPAAPALGCPPNARCFEGMAIAQQQQVSLGFPRDTFWPKSAAAFVVLGLALTLASAQLVSPTRRLRLPRLGRPTLRRRGLGNQPVSTTSDTAPATGTAEEPVLANSAIDQKVEMAE
jgi:ABC-type transport system involved in multi-copper enzyme maturation permease subunit